MSNVDWASIVPEVTLRQQQVEVLNQVADAIEDGKRFILVEAPPGAGKSIILLALCRWQGSGHVVTPQKVLQDQLGQMPGTAVVKGRSAYYCELSGETAVDAPCTVSGRNPKQPECASSVCQYYGAIERAQRSKVAVHSYASLLAQSRMTDHFSKRPILALDEAHTAGNWVKGYFEVTITYNEMHELSQRVPKTEDVPRWLAGMASVIDSDSMHNRRLKNILRKVRGEAEAFGVVTDLQGWSVNDIDDLPYEPAVEFVSEYDPRRESVTIRPLRSGVLSKNLLRLGEVVVAASATVIDPDMLLAELGIPKAEAAFVKTDYSFDYQRRQIIRKYVGAVSSKTEQALSGKLVNAVMELATAHAGERGIIHTPSYNLSNALFDRLSTLSPRFVKFTPAKRTEIINHFLSGTLGPDVILVGPGMSEGIDGIDDALRWQVITKMPWPSMADPLVVALRSSGRQSLADKWVNWKTVQSLSQTVGRVCRHAEDHGVTYVLDSNMDRLIQHLPPYVVKAIL